MIWFSTTGRGLFEAHEVGARVPESITLEIPAVLAPSRHKGGFCYSVRAVVRLSDKSGSFVVPAPSMLTQHHLTGLEVSLGDRALSKSDAHHWYRVLADVGGAFFCCGRLDELEKYARWLAGRGEMPPSCRCSLQESTSV